MEFRKVTIIQTIGPNSYVIRCNFCEGRGAAPFVMGNNWKIIDWHTYECPVCDGKGALRVESPDIPIYDGVCQGTGHETYSAPLNRCKKCMGVGVRSLTGELKVLK